MTNTDILNNDRID